MVLLDDHFATIVRAIREGRRIYDNIRPFTRYAVTINSGEIWIMFLAPLIGLPVPLLLIQILWINLVTDGLPGLVLSGQAWAMAAGASWQTIVFTTLCLAQLAHVLAIRSERVSLFKLGVLSNRPLLDAAVLTGLLQLATIYVPALNAIFKTAPLRPAELALTVGIASVVFWAVEGEKWLRRRR